MLNVEALFAARKPNPNIKNIKNVDFAGSLPPNPSASFSDPRVPMGSPNNLAFLKQNVRFFTTIEFIGYKRGEIIIGNGDATYNEEKGRWEIPNGTKPGHGMMGFEVRHSWFNFKDFSAKIAKSGKGFAMVYRGDGKVILDVQKNSHQYGRPGKAVPDGRRINIYREEREIRVIYWGDLPEGDF